MPRALPVIRGYVQDNDVLINLYKQEFAAEKHMIERYLDEYKFRNSIRKDPAFRHNRRGGDEDSDDDDDYPYKNQFQQRYVDESFFFTGTVATRINLNQLPQAPQQQ